MKSGEVNISRLEYEYTGVRTVDTQQRPSHDPLPEQAETRPGRNFRGDDDGAVLILQRPVKACQIQYVSKDSERVREQQSSYGDGPRHGGGGWEERSAAAAI